RQFAPPASMLRDIGTLLMLLWLPVIGNIVAWLVAKVRRPASPGLSGQVGQLPAVFGAPGTFSPHALVELTLREAKLPIEDTPIAAGEHHCALVVGNDGFTARWFVRPDDAVRRGKAHALQVEFLTPAVALPRFQRDVTFRMLVGGAFIGDGRVLEVLGGA
ncbi:MAG: hypothetical protein ABJA77_11890, partial [Variovorax sp.]